jgi:plastocyanin
VIRVTAGSLCGASFVRVAGFRVPSSLRTIVAEDPLLPFLGGFMRGFGFFLSLAGVLAATSLAGCGGQAGTSSLPGSGTTGTMSVGHGMPAVDLTVDAAETVGINLSGQAVTKNRHYGKVLGYFLGATKTKSMVVMLPVGSQVTFSNLDSVLPHTASLLGDATKKHAAWPKTFTGSGTQSKAGTDISTTGFSTGTLNPGSKSLTYPAAVPGFYMFGCAFHYLSHGMRTVIIVH